MNGHGKHNELLRPYRIGQLSSTTSDSAACTSAAVKTPVSCESAARSSARWCHAAVATNSIRIRVADQTANPRRVGSEGVVAVSEPGEPRRRVRPHVLRCVQDSVALVLVLPARHGTHGWGARLFWPRRGLPGRYEVDSPACNARCRFGRPLAAGPAVEGYAAAAVGGDGELRRD